MGPMSRAFLLPEVLAEEAKALAPVQGMTAYALVIE